MVDLNLCFFILHLQSCDLYLHALSSFFNKTMSNDYRRISSKPRIDKKLINIRFSEGDKSGAEYIFYYLLLTRWWIPYKLNTKSIIIQILIKMKFLLYTMKFLTLSIRPFLGSSDCLLFFYLISCRKWVPSELKIF